MRNHQPHPAMFKRHGHIGGHGDKWQIPMSRDDEQGEQEEQGRNGKDEDHIIIITGGIASSPAHYGDKRQRQFKDTHTTDSSSPSLAEEDTSDHASSYENILSSPSFPRRRKDDIVIQNESSILARRRHQNKKKKKKKNEKRQVNDENDDESEHKKGQEGLGSLGSAPDGVLLTVVDAATPSSVTATENEDDENEMRTWTTTAAEVGAASYTQEAEDSFDSEQLQIAPSFLDINPSYATAATTPAVSPTAVGASSLPGSAFLAHPAPFAPPFLVSGIDNDHSNGVSFPPTPSSTVKANQSTTSRTQQNDNFWPFLLAIMFFVILAIYVLMAAPAFARALATGSFRRGWYLRPSAPRITQVKAAYPVPVRRIRNYRARLRGLYNRFLLPNVPFLDLTRGQCAVLFLYLASVVTAVFAQGGSPPKDVIRSGRIAVAQFPVLFALATKNSVLGLTGKSYEKLNFLHRFAGRSVIVCALIHSIFYIRKLDAADFLNPSKVDVQLTGIISMCIATFILFTSFRFVRNVAYQFFIVSHILGWIAFLVAVYMHVEYARPWIYISLALIGADLIARLCKMRFRNATLTPLEGGITGIEVAGARSGWRAGQHVWLRTFSLRHAIEVHPFSIANAAELNPLVRYHFDQSGTGSSNEGLVVYAKSCGRWTSTLHRNASKVITTTNSTNSSRSSIGNERHWNDDLESRRQQLDTEKNGQVDAAPQKKVRLLIDGPYGVNFTVFSELETVLLVAGGSGITFILNILEDIVANAIQANSCTRRINLIYTIKSVKTAHVFLSKISEIIQSASYLCSFLDIQVQVYETGTSPSAAAPITSGFNQCWEEGNSVEEKDPFGLFFGSSGMHLYRGQRPDLVTCLNHSLNDTRPVDNETMLGGGVALVSCGPKGLAAAARSAAGKADQNLAYRAGGIVVHSETFGW